jgi:hypothetical protein
VKRWVVVVASLFLVALAATIVISLGVLAWKTVPKDCTPPPKGTIEILREKTEACAAQCKAAGSSLKSFDDSSAWGVGKCECQSCGGAP